VREPYILHRLNNLSCAAQAGVLDEPALGLAGWKFAAPQPVIVSERRSRESNDLNWRSHPILSSILMWHRHSCRSLARFRFFPIAGLLCAP
jgi:hypothetical protein